MDNKYSVLMSVYHKDSPKYLRTAINSIVCQTLPADEIILVCDGPLNDELNQVIEAFENQLDVVRLPENRGLGYALSEGLKHCHNDWIARMDSDDIASYNRCDLQMRYLQAHPETDILSGTLAEFAGDSGTMEEAAEHVLAYKILPGEHSEIAEYIKYRNPVNHPCVMFRKSKVLEAGGYQSCYLFEDYDLWVRMYMKNCRFANLSETILYMRVNEMHKRRGGIRYAKAIIDFRTKMYRYKVISLPQYLYTTAARVVVSLMPNPIRKLIYDAKLRNH